MCIQIYVYVRKMCIYICTHTHTFVATSPPGQRVKVPLVLSPATLVELPKLRSEAQHTPGVRVQGLGVKVVGLGFRGLGFRIPKMSVKGGGPSRDTEKGYYKPLRLFSVSQAKK